MNSPEKSISTRLNGSTEEWQYLSEGKALFVQDTYHGTCLQLVLELSHWLGHRLREFLEECLHTAEYLAELVLWRDLRPLGFRTFLFPSPQLIEFILVMKFY